jgi:pseudoazurin
MNSVWKMLTLATTLAALMGPASAAEHEIKMLNTGAGGAMVFEPAFVRIQPGDSVKFVATHKGHNAQSVDVVRPDGGTQFQGKMNEEISITFDKPGVYGYECKPHIGLGMVGLIVVGDPSANLDTAKKATFRGKAKERFEALLKRIEG